MKLSIMVAALVALAVGGSVARAEGWDSKGWVKLGEREVNVRVDHDRIEGASWHPEVKHFFKEGQRTRVIDFPGDERTIKFIDFKYRNLPGGGRAKVQVWAK